MKKLFLIPLLALPLLATPTQAQPLAQSPQQTVTDALETMRAKKLTPRQAWDQGLITKSVLLRALTDDTLLDPNRRWWKLYRSGQNEPRRQHQ